MHLDPSTLTNALDISDVVDYEITKVELGNVPVVSKEDPGEDDENKSLDADFDYARGNQFQIIEAGKDALNKALEFATQSENARSYEVVGAMLKNLADVNKQLLEMHELKQKIKTKKEADVDKAQTVNNTQNNIVFQGSTVELLKQIRLTSNG